eukprot:EG_transcript_5316
MSRWLIPCIFLLECKLFYCKESSDCSGDWSVWSVCSPECGTGFQYREYTVSQARKGDGKDCPYSDGKKQQRLCQNNQPCFVGDTCMIKQWNAVSKAFRCVQVGDTSTEIILATCTGGDNQLWLIDRTSDPQFYSLESQLRINDKTACLMAAYDDVAQSTWRRNVFAWPCTPTDTFQRWAISTAVPSPQNRGFIRNEGADLCLDFDQTKGVSAGVAFDLANVIVSTCTDNSAMWIVDCNKDCLYGEWGSWSGCSQMCGGGTQNRTRQPILSARTECDDVVQQQPCNGWPCEKAESCMIRPTSDRYHLKCLGLSESDYSLVARPCTGEARQLWSYNGMFLKSEILINHQEVCLTVQKDLGLRAWPCNNGTDDSQKFDRYFDQIAAVGPALCVTVEGFLNYDVTTQNTILDVCIAGDNQNFVFDCVASDVCVNFCPGACACHLDASLQPYCDCPGASCNNVPCMNGGERYYDGTVCRCRCPPGYFGDQCEKPQQCVYSEWSSWTICTQLCGGGKTTRARTALIYPEICLDVTDIGDCNMQPCVPIGGAALLPATDTVFGVTPFAGCRMMPIDSPTNCLTNGAGGALGLAPCSGASAVAQSWSYDGKTNFNVQGRCIDISGGVSGTSLISWDCHGGPNQMFSFGNRMLQATDGRCVAHGPGGEVFLTNCQSSAGWTTDCTQWPSSSAPGGASEVLPPTEGL